MADVDSEQIDARVLEETLSKVSSLTDQITNSLHKLSKGGARAERAIRPISGKTRMMTIYGNNLEGSSNVIQGIRDYAKLSEEYERTIEAGPENVGVEPYAQAVETLDKALNELKQSPLNSFYKVVGKMEKLVKQGKTALRDYFINLLTEIYKPIDVNMYVNQNIPMPKIPRERIPVLRQLFEYFEQVKELVDSTYKEKVSNYVLSSVSPLAKSTRPKPSKGPYEKGSNAIHVYTAALKGLLWAESENLQNLFPDKPKLQGHYFEEIVKLAVADFISIVDNLNDHIKRNMSTDSLITFEVIECIGQIMTTVQSISKQTPNNLSEAMKRMQTTAQEVFTDFLRHIETRINNMQTLPAETGVCDATVDIMSRMGRLSEYKNSALMSISNSSIHSWIPSNPKPQWASILASPGPTSGDPLELLSAYFSDAIDAIVLILETRAKYTGKKNSQVGLFMLTNIALIERYVTKSEIYKILGASGADRIDRLKKRAYNLFLEQWKAAASHLMDTTVIKPGNKQLSSKDREAIKEKFKTFNSEFDFLIQQHKNYKISDKQLNENLVKEISFISPLYHRFYDRHCGGDFSKNVDKYIKYDKPQFDEKIESLKK